jgi:hypothetical protein
MTRPSPHQGLVTLPGHEPLPAWISNLRRQRITVSLHDRPPVPLRRLLGGRVTVEYAGPIGVLHADGIVDATGPGATTFALVLPETPVLEQRSEVRVNAMVPVALRPVGGLHWVHTFTQDLSGGGMLVAGPDVLEPGATVDFRLATAHELPAVGGRARVQRILEQGQRALTYTEIDPAERERLVRFVFQRERAALKAGQR